MDNLWAGWRSTYIKGAGEADEGDCLFCRLLNQPDEEALILVRGETVFTVLNRYPYTTGHVMIAPTRHVAEPAGLNKTELLALWEFLAKAQHAIERAMSPAGFNLGANLGRVAGAGVPGHFHLHLVPRWEGDANFMTTIGATRVIPEDLADTYENLRRALRT